MKGEIPALPDAVFPAFPPSLQSLPSLTLPLLFLPSPLPPSSYFLALWNWSVQDKKGNECTLDSALNRLTHFIDDADDTLLMILIKIGSWQADMFQYDNVASVVLSFPFLHLFIWQENTYLHKIWSSTVVIIFIVQILQNMCMLFTCRRSFSSALL